VAAFAPVHNPYFFTGMMLFQASPQWVNFVEIQSFRTYSVLTFTQTMGSVQYNDLAHEKSDEC
jgi:hypothetical protein